MGRWLDDATEAKGGHAFGVMACYRSWAHWCARLDAGGYQVRHVAHRKDRLQPDQILEALCEVYSRAIFEVALAMEYDKMDSQVDHQVLLQITEAFGLAVADEVHRWVNELGPVVVRTLDSGVKQLSGGENGDQ